MPTSGRSDESGFEKLSAREEQILGLAADGLLDKQIALTLGLSENTLRTHWRRVRNKMGEAPRSALAAQYVKERSLASLEDEGFLTLDLKTRIVHYQGDRDILPQGETPLDDALLAFHPGDRDRLRELIEQMIARETPPITAMARVLTPTGIETACFQLEPLYGSGGNIVSLLGRAVNIYDLTKDTNGAARFGSYRRDLYTGEVQVDDGLREIYRIPPDEKDLRDAVIRNYCPASRARMLTLVDGMIAAGSRRRKWTACLCFPNGDKVWVSPQSWIEERDGRPSAFAATAVALY